MKLRYKIGVGCLTLVVVALAALALVISHDSPCTPAGTPTAGTNTMRAIVGRCYGPSDVLELVKIEKPTPAEGEVLIRVRAASVNPLDWHYMRGSPYIMRLESGLGKPANPRIGVDFAGTVEAVGQSVTRFKPGDAVFGGRTGAFAEYVTVGEDRALTLMPANVSFEQAAAIPIAGITALQALRDKAGVKPGQSVLINGASGGVGTFAVQIAKSMGARVTGVCSTGNVEMVRALGADQVIDYTRENVLDSTRQFDVIIDNVGNLGLLKVPAILAPSGTIVLVGAPSGNWVKPLLRPLSALLVAPFFDQEFAFLLAEFNQPDLDYLGDLVRAGKMTSVIDRSYALAEVPAAITYSETGHARGKIAIVVP